MLEQVHEGPHLCRPSKVETVYRDFWPGQRSAQVRALISSYSIASPALTESISEEWGFMQGYAGQARARALKSLSVLLNFWLQHRAAQPVHVIFFFRFRTSLCPQLMLAKLVQPYHLKVFFSNKFVHASILDTLQNVCVTSVSTNNKLFTDLVGATKPKNDVRACLAVAKLLAEKAQGLQVTPEARLALLKVTEALSCAALGLCL